jgi:hypothetical protein
MNKMGRMHNKSPEQTKENRKHICEGSESPCRDSNRLSPEYEARVPTSAPRHQVFIAAYLKLNLLLKIILVHVP